MSDQLIDGSSLDEFIEGVRATCFDEHNNYLSSYNEGYADACDEIQEKLAIQRNKPASWTLERLLEAETLSRTNNEPFIAVHAYEAIMGKLKIEEKGL